MIVKLDTDYHSHLLMYPCRNGHGELTSLQIRAIFINPETGVRIPGELVMPRITPQEHVLLFREKFALVKLWRHFFISRNLLAWININEAVAEFILNDEEMAAEITQHSYLELAINENFPEINKGNKNKLLAALAQRYPLVLANFGAGIATTRPIVDGLFTRVILDRAFVQRHITQASFEPFMRALIYHLSPWCGSLIIAGIDSQEARKLAYPLGFNAMQGALWPAVEPEDLASLV